MGPLRFSTEDGVSLEGDLRLPEGDPVGTAVICHAHPRRGGSKDHPLLWAVRNDLSSRGFAVLGFNFRGVMRSGGSYGAGRTEVKDARAAIGHVRDVATGPSVVCGWSFGASVALREALEDERVTALALIGLPLEPGALEVPDLPTASEMRALRRPVLLLAGEGDQYCPRPALENLARKLPNARTSILPGTDHFLWRREREAAATIGAFAEDVAGR
jgi:hypothetical protein